MRRTHILLLTVLCLPSGCMVTSEKPFFIEKDVFEPDGIDGVWKLETWMGIDTRNVGDVYAVFIRGEAKQLKWLNGDLHTEKFTITFFQAGHCSYCDLGSRRLSGIQGPAGESDMRFHYLFEMVKNGDQFELIPLSAKWVRENERRLGVKNESGIAGNRRRTHLDIRPEVWKKLLAEKDEGQVMFAKCHRFVLRNDLDRVIRTMDDADRKKVERARDVLKAYRSVDVMGKLIDSLPDKDLRPTWQVMQKLDVIRDYLFHSNLFDWEYGGSPPEFGADGRKWRSWFRKHKDKIEFLEDEEIRKER